MTAPGTQPFGDRAFAAIVVAKRANAALTTAAAGAIIEGLFQLELKALKVRPKKQNMAVLTEDQFIAYLEAQPVYQPIDVKREIGKCQVWCQPGGKRPTRRRIIAWLNKALSDAPMQTSQQGRSSQAPRANFDIYALPPVGWEGMAIKLYGEGITGKGWPDIRAVYGREILKAMASA